MSTQSYYKDRLGFDPREALYESSGGSATGQQSTTIKTGSRSSRIVQHHHYSSSTHHSNGGSGGGNGPNNNHYSDYQHATPSKKLKHSSNAQYSSRTELSSHTGYGSGGGGGGSGINISANIAAINNNSNNQSGDGYEDALTQFKGTMSIWDYFVENWDVTGTPIQNVKNTNFAFSCFPNTKLFFLPSFCFGLIFFFVFCYFVGMINFFRCVI